ncbi:hypothetical protein [Flavobacterium hungaricum]|uniref:PH domain-containing protein n=1 Tax=Flavobacterium hungaricum TaxID=2082725 RepID=A0ABR9TFY2_9FLAO|nr:hypothetical protein [Flavobacterium hungaricum]MBE8724253.1 hypothetical protein [Flavobacterium hungaricum]
MEVKSKFRKLFWVRTGIGFLVFIIILNICLSSISQYSQLSKNPIFIVSFLFLLFCLIAALTLLETFKLIITDQGIIKIFIISGRKKEIPFSSIINLKNQKVRMQTRAGHLTDGYTLSILTLNNNSDLKISPDIFSNYNEIMTAIKSKLE